MASFRFFEEFSTPIHVIGAIAVAHLGLPFASFRRIKSESLHQLLNASIRSADNAYPTLARCVDIEETPNIPITLTGS